MTVLVTGGSGFIGRHVVRALLASGRPVRSMDLRHPEPIGEDQLTGSVLNLADVGAAMRDISGVIHLAANAMLWAPGRFDHDRINTIGTCRVLAQARRCGVKMVHVSSFVTLVGRSQTVGAVLDETVEAPPSAMIGSYARSKRQSELVALSAHHAGQPVTIVQPSAPIGAGDHAMTPPGRMIRDFALGRTPAVLDCTLNLVDVRAVADAIIAALDKGEDGARYLLSGEDLPMHTVAGLIASQTGVRAPSIKVPFTIALMAARAEAVVSRMTGRAPTAPLAGVQFAERRCRFSNKKAREALGFDPRPAAECLGEAIQWMRQAGHLPAAG